MKHFSIFLAVALVPCVWAGAQTLSLGVPSEVGMDSDILQSGVKMFEKAVDRDETRGAVLLVARNGLVVVHEAVGWKDRELGLPMKKDAMFRMASNTKPVVAAGIALLQERGALQFDDPVHRHIKAFDNDRAREMTLHHLLTHTSGFRIKPIFYKPLIEKSDRHPNAPSLKLEVDRFGETGAAEPVGNSYSYSNAGYNTLGAVIETASHKRLEVYLEQSIYAPLGMRDSYHHEVAEKLDGKLDRMSTVYYKKEGEWTVGWKPGQPPKYPFVRASGGMISTAIDYAVFCQMFLNDGVYGGQRILKAETVRRMTAPQTESLYEPIERAKRDRFYGYGWAALNEGVFGHSGSDGTAAWVDPANQLIVLVFTQSPSGNSLRDRFFKLVQLSIEKP
ncbi:MAG: serine hydrolase domain-containing protein [Verrucomicrobiia bacterium]|jgi:CubicO group peptidase (beta-lactamase class C family)